ncbi:phage tail protein [Hymenobacter jeollabukensis]|uniref:Phage tail protein n=1 Tax=Hymenobacter jeollabukensis TaxID=2025313 RepID=A0A5R8WUG0_9BACT|nr:tail fiber protein [Hymenobacter jeollabukensis]TLM95034.1 phage tail protein [Hymenobacter jeollabukensis]
MAHASTSLSTRRSWLRRVQDWLQPAAPAPSAPSLTPRRSFLNVNANLPYVGEIAIFAGSFAPNGWFFCDGRLLPISEYETLFQLIGTTYGGDGESTFALPNLNGRAPMHFVSGPGLGNRQLAEIGGQEEVTLTTQQMPSHNHTLAASTAPGTTASPSGAVPADGGNGSAQYTQDTGNLVQQPAQNLPVVGGSQPHQNMQPFLVVNYIISMFGVFPQP